MAFTEITFMQILGKPLIFWIGISTISVIFVTAIIGYLIYKGKTKIQFKWHMRLVALSLILALIHGTLGALIYI